MRLRFVAQTAVAILLAAWLAGCSSMGSLFGNSDSGTLDTRPPDVMYKDAEDKLANGSSTKAAEIFERIDQLYPYSEESKKATLMAAVAYQKAGKGAEAVAAARRYLQLHPGTKDAAQAQQIIAGSYFDRVSSPDSRSGRNQEGDRRAGNAHPPLSEQ